MSRAALYDETGGPEVLYVGEVPDPDPGPGQVAVLVRAAGINPYDAKVRRGFLTSRVPFPRRIGSDLAGVVEAVGEGASYWDGTAVAVGDEVLGHGPGAVAERVVTQATNLVRRPKQLPARVAAGLHVPGLTAASCLATIPIGAGDTVLVGGASGAVGMLVCQLAADAGATVIGTASPRNHGFLRGLGVTPVAYGEGLTGRVLRTGVVTAVVDCHGREALDAGVELGVPTDRMVAIAAYEALEEIPAHNVERSARPPRELSRLATMMADGRLTLPVAAGFPLEEVAQAFAALDSSHEPGKIIVEM